MTILHVTHDYEEAITLGNNVAVLNEGKIIQTGSIAEVFQHPRHAFTASFTGIKNFYSARLIPPETVAESDMTRAQISPEVSFFLQDQDFQGNGFIVLSAEDIIISHSRQDSSARNNFPGTILEISPGMKGYEITVDIGVPVHAVITRSALSSLHLLEGNEIWVSFKASALRFIAV
jgi:molybdopterin-binding protein